MRRASGWWRAGPVEQPGGAEQQRARCTPTWCSVVVGCAAVIHRTIALSGVASARVAKPPPTSSTSGGGTSSNVWLDVEVDQAVVVATAGRSARRTARPRAPGTLAEHLVGADDVQEGEAGVEADGDLHGGGPSWWSRGRCGGGFSGPASGRSAGEVLAVAGRGGPEASADGTVQALGAHQADLARHGVDGQVRGLEQCVGRPPGGPPRRRRPEWCRSRRATPARRSARSCRRGPRAAATPRSSCRWSGTQRCSSRSSARRAGRARSWAENCDWPPGRRANTTSQRGDLVGQLCAVVVLDEGQGQVDPGGDAGRGPAVADRARRCGPRGPSRPGGRWQARRMPTSASWPGTRRADRLRRAAARRCRPTSSVEPSRRRCAGRRAGPRPRPRRGPQAARSPSTCPRRGR